MTLLEAFGAIFTGIWLFISAPGTMIFIGAAVAVVGFVMFLMACALGHEGRSEFWQRMSFFVGGPLVMIIGIAFIMWAGSSSSSPLTWR